MGMSRCEIETITEPAQGRCSVIQSDGSTSRQSEPMSEETRDGEDAEEGVEGMVP